MSVRKYLNNRHATCHSRRKWSATQKRGIKENENEGGAEMSWHDFVHCHICNVRCELEFLAIPRYI